MTSFVCELAKILDIDLSDEEMAIAMHGAAMATLEKAASGELVTDSLTYQQLGTVTAALHWNTNPMIRQAVRVRENGQ